MARFDLNFNHFQNPERENGYQVQCEMCDNYTQDWMIVEIEQLDVKIRGPDGWQRVYKDGKEPLCVKCARKVLGRLRKALLNLETTIKLNSEVSLDEF